MTAPLPAENTETLWRGDFYQWRDTIKKNTGTEEAPVWTAKDVSGYTYRSQLKADPDDETPVAVLVVEPETDGTDGVLIRTLLASESRKLAPGPVYFDLELTLASDPERVQTYLAGVWTIDADVSRAVPV